VLDRIFRTFHFHEFWNSSVFEVWKFFGNIRSFWTRENSSEISSKIISCFWVKKFGKSCSIPNFPKMTLKSNFGNHKKLGPTRKPTPMFGLKFGMQGLNIEDQMIKYFSLSHREERVGRQFQRGLSHRSVFCFCSISFFCPFQSLSPISG